MSDVCIVGGGPAGMITGLLLARQGIEVTVLEKHDDFLRDFRGDTIHPSTLEILGELGLMEEFLELPHNRMEQVSVKFGDTEFTLADFSKLPVPYIAFVPQWHFLDLLADYASRLPSFTLRMGAEVVELQREEGGRVNGVTVQSAGRREYVSADLVIGADGRNSTVRELLGLQALVTGPSMEVFWFRLPRNECESMPLFTAGDGALICIDRGDYWQVAYAMHPVEARRLQSRGLMEFRRRVSLLEKTLQDRLDRLESWADISVLHARIDRLERWDVDGALCIGDAAHAMSPAGGVGVNLAIQDAVATARILGPKLLMISEGEAVDLDLDAIRKRREWPVRVIQMVQGWMTEGIATPRRGRTQWPAFTARRIMRRVPTLSHLMGRIIGLGVRPERVGSVSMRNDLAAG